jgi:hypothetical protein
MSKIAILAMVLSGIAFAHISVRGAILVEGKRYEDGELPGFYDESPYKLRNGWPVPFGEHTVSYASYRFWHSWPVGDFRLRSVTAAICDLFLAVVLITATGIAASRFARRLSGRFQFTIADMLALTAAVGMVLGFIGIDQLRYVEDIYTPLHRCTPFDLTMVLLGVGCAVALIVSTVCARLGSAPSGRASAAADSDPPSEEKRP